MPLFGTTRGFFISVSPVRQASLVYRSVQLIRLSPRGVQIEALSRSQTRRRTVRLSVRLICHSDFCIPFQIKLIIIKYVLELAPLSRLLTALGEFILIFYSYFRREHRLESSIASNTGLVFARYPHSWTDPTRVLKSYSPPNYYKFHSTVTTPIPTFEPICHATL